MPSAMEPHGEGTRDPNATRVQIQTFIDKNRDGSSPNVTRWLRKVHSKLQRQFTNRKVPLGEFLSLVDVHINGNAADCAFGSLVLGRYGGRPLDASGLALPSLRALRQIPCTDLQELYHRPLKLLLKCGGTDPAETQTLSGTENSLLSIAVKAFCGALAVLHRGRRHLVIRIHSLETCFHTAPDGNGPCTPRHRSGGHAPDGKGWVSHPTTVALDSEAATLKMGFQFYLDVDKLFAFPRQPHSGRRLAQLELRLCFLQPATTRTHVLMRYSND